MIKVKCPHCKNLLPKPISKRMNCSSCGSELAIKNSYVFGMYFELLVFYGAIFAGYHFLYLQNQTFSLIFIVLVLGNITGISFISLYPRDGIFRVVDLSEQGRNV